MNPTDPVRLLVAGPLLALFLMASLAALALLAALFGRLGPLVQLGMGAAARLETGRVVPTLWGLSASLLLLFVAALLFNTHVLALLGVVVLAATLALAGLGLATAALSLGTRLIEALGLLDMDTLTALRLGLWAIGLTAAIPFLGWLLAVLTLASGIGAVLETLIGRKPAAE